MKEARPTRIDALARQAGAGLLEEVVAEARQEAKERLRSLLVDAIVAEATSSGQAATSDPATPSDPAPPLVPDAVGPRHLPPAPVAGGSAPGEEVRGLYVYGFVGGHALVTDGLSGVDGAGAYPVGRGDLAAVVSDIATDRRGWGVDDDGEPDLRRLTPRLTAHQRLLEMLMERTTVLPMRFGTVFPDAAALAGALDAHAADISAGLARLAGKVEWGLSVTWEAPDASLARRPEPTGGRSYLDRRRQELEWQEEKARRGAEIGSRLHGCIRRRAADSTVHPLGAPAEGQPPVVLRASYLVERAARRDFEAAIVAALRDGGPDALSGELTGPWPPYNFSTLTMGAGAHG